MKKILIAISDDFTRYVYSQVFREEKFEVLETRSGKETLNLAKSEKPDIILADILLLEIGGLELLKTLREEPLTKKIPVVIFTQLEKEGDKLKAMDLGAKDFIVGTFTPPLEAVLRIKIALGEEKTYRLTIPENLVVVQELAKDLGYNPSLKCLKCGNLLSLFLIKDLSKGKNYFKISFICPKCN